MPKSATELARELIERDGNELEELRLHMFGLDGDEFDEELDEQLHTEFSAEFERVQSELTTAFGEPMRTGSEDDGEIPLNGVFRFAIWKAGGEKLFVAAAHEDRGLPVLLMLGTLADDKV